MFFSTATLNALRVGVNSKFQAAWDAVTAEQLWYKQLADITTSKDASEVYRMNDTANRLREWVGDRTVRHLTEKSYTLANRKFEQTIGMSVEDYEDDKWNNLNSGVRSMGRAARLWPNDLVEEALLAGGSAACYDGQYFFDTDHPLEVQGSAATTQSNLHTSTALTVANYVATRLAMMTRKGADGKCMGIVPNALVVPAALEQTAKRILETDLVGYLANTSSTAVDSNIWKNSAKPLVLPFLDASSATTWYLADLSFPFKPLVFQKRVAPSKIIMLNKADDQNVFLNDEILFGVRGRGAAGYGLWQTMDKCTA